MCVNRGEVDDCGSDVFCYNASMLDVVLQWGYIGPATLIVVGMVILVSGGEILVRGASQLAVATKIPPVIVGLTIVAFGTSAPELAVSLSAVLKGSADLAVGNVVGSNICNIGLILGIAALLSPIAVSSSLIRREIPIMVVLTFLMYLLAVFGTTTPVSELFCEQFDGGLILPWGGGLLVALLVAYMGWTIFELRYRKESNRVYAHELEENVLPDKECPEQKIGGWKHMLLYVLLIITGIILLVIGSDLMVQGSVRIAKLMGVSEFIIGLTILAVGTSLPELMVTLLAAMKRQSDIAIGNVIGSNIFNVLGVLGITALFSGGTSYGGLQVSAQALRFDMPVMILMSLFCMVICITGRRVTRGEGVFLLLCYAAYIAALCVMAGS